MKHYPEIFPTMRGSRKPNTIHIHIDNGTPSPKKKKQVVNTQETAEDQVEEADPFQPDHCCKLVLYLLPSSELYRTNDIYLGSRKKHQHKTTAVSVSPDNSTNRRAARSASQKPTWTNPSATTLWPSTPPNSPSNPPSTNCKSSAIPKVALSYVCSTSRKRIHSMIL